MHKVFQQYLLVTLMIKSGGKKKKDLVLRAVLFLG